MIRLMRKNNIITLIIILLTTVIVTPSCSSDKNVYNEELFQFNNIFIHQAYRRIFEDKNYIYINSLENRNITRLNKITGEVKDLGIQGENLTIYKNYLYYLTTNKNANHLSYLYRINLNKLNKKPELVNKELDSMPYIIINDTIYFYWAYTSAFSMSINNFSQVTIVPAVSSRYLIAGFDNKYVYIITQKISDKNTVISLSRCLHKDKKFENKEYLCNLKGIPTKDYRFNDFLIVKNNFAYYIGENNNLYKCELKPQAESKIIYENNGYEIMAVTNQWIYISKFYSIKTAPFKIYNDYIYRLDLNGKNEIQLNYSTDLLYFVNNDAKLCYIQNNQIHAIE